MVSTEEKLKFEKICLDLREEKPISEGIGTYQEKTLHRILKKYVCPKTQLHEVEIGNFIADAILENTIYEIQSAGLFPLKKKIAYYIEHTDKKIKIVCPILTAKRVIWVNPESGETSTPRKSPVGHGKMRVLPELVYLLPVLDFERVSFLIIGIEADDYKLLNGKGSDKKHGASRIERIPRSLTMLKSLSSKEDIASFFMPTELEKTFCSSDFSRLTNLRRRTLSAALKVLTSLQIICADGKKGNAVMYRRLL